MTTREKLYESFLMTKAYEHESVGFVSESFHPSLFPFQRDIVRWAIRKGRAAIFADCGLGKTFQQLEWASQVAAHTSRPVLILAPLAVTTQTVEEANRFGYQAAAVRAMPVAPHAPIVVANYEMLERFDPNAFGGIVLDESSILKSFDGATRTLIIERFGTVPFRLACTATPSPNDYMELGNHAEFLGVMRRSEMLAMYFVHDGGETQTWRLKRHAQTAFWEWMATWAVMIRRPSDLGYSDEGFALPPLTTSSLIVASASGEATARGLLFDLPASTLTERREARKASLGARVAAVAEKVNASDEAWLLWCNLNAEGDALARLIPDAVQVAGADSMAVKESRLMGFTHGHHRVMITKPSIAGFGMNWQQCRNVVFVGLSDSYEQYYQAIRRCWRFGQTRDVRVHLVIGEAESPILVNIQRKHKEAMHMAEQMAAQMANMTRAELTGRPRQGQTYNAATATGASWKMVMGDCVPVVRDLDEASVDYTIFSPPFASLYTYSDADRDMGNVKDAREFFRHFRFLIPELLRVTKPGRLLSFHCMNLPTSKARDGVIGITDFRGHLIRNFVKAGWIFHSEVVIWKDPVTAMQRTKAIGLLHKQLKKDSALSRQGLPDYLVTMRSPGLNPKPIAHTAETFPVSLWQRYASPVWMDINPTKTLQYRAAREANDERHICPLQLEVIERAIALWSAPDDLILSPFAGIGSEGYEAIKVGRRFLGIELKRSYWQQACANLAHAESLRENGMLFSHDHDTEERARRSC